MQIHLNSKGQHQVSSGHHVLGLLFVEHPAPAQSLRMIPLLSSEIILADNHASFYILSTKYRKVPMIPSDHMIVVNRENKLNSTTHKGVLISFFTEILFAEKSAQDWFTRISDPDFISDPYEYIEYQQVI